MVIFLIQIVYLQKKLKNIMKKNIGNIDRIIRIVLVIGFSYVAYFFNFEDWKSYTAAALSIVVLATIVTKFCPIYYILNLNSSNFDINIDN